MVDAEKCMVWFVRVLKCLAIVTLCLCIAAYCFIINVAVNSELDAFEITFIVAAYLGFIIFSVILLVAEFEPVWFIKRVYILHFWAGRGFWLLWLGIQLIASSKSIASAVKHGGGTDNTDFMEILGQVVGWVMISVGTAFCLMSALCIRNCTPETDKDRELEAALNGSDSKGDDAILAANLALCIGMSPEQARKQFKGSKGAREANKFAQANADKLMKATVAADAATNAARQSGEQAKQFAAVAAENQRGAAVESANANAAYMSKAADSYQAPSMQAERGASMNDDGPQKGGDADDLEAQYYKNAAFNH